MVLVVVLELVLVLALGYVHMGCTESTSPNL